uniref:Cleavage inducing molecular chaperone Jiv domain-containing protein n=1 Tax=Zosterops lateralis melanops TaxID=1220523 RepID=A0A8D2Q326_ZOSLA
MGTLQEELRDAMDAMGCTRCGGRHRRFQLDRDPRGARYCGPCGGWHSAEEGDLWAESSLMGLKVTYLARMDGHIYDVTGEGTPGRGHGAETRPEGGDRDPRA